MPTRQQKLECMVRSLNVANADGDHEGCVYWRDRIADFVWTHIRRITIASGK